MALLAAANYDPGTAVSQSTASLLAMTALDTTNLRLTFVAPATGNVWCRLRGTTTGSGATVRILLGILDGATVRLRMPPYAAIASTGNTVLCTQEVCGVVTGLTPGTSYTWDAAYGVELATASTNLKYGGPNDTTGADAWGGFVFEVWECPTLIAGVLYDPAAAVSKSTTALTAMTAFDTTNLRQTITTPPSGNILWRIKCANHGSSTPAQVLLGLLEGATVVARVAAITGASTAFGTTTQCGFEASGVLTPTAGSHTYDAAYAVQVVSSANGAIKYGGPNNTTQNDAFGGIAFELWNTA